MAASSQNYYQLYMNDVLTLAQTIVIKSVATANALNTYVQEQMGGTVDSTDPTTWKYYLNLGGQYHPTDTMMTVTSMDTLETIDFTIANLAVNTATARGYQYGTRSYLELVSNYPDQEMLILGILYPVDIDAAIAGYDGQILGYPPNLIEVNEYSFVAKLQEYITGYIGRWYNAQYTSSDELYSAAFLGMMYLMLVPAILSIRNNACGTHEAHSFHVLEYLSSNGDLGQYYQYLTTEQALWLYRNIKYIQRHPGAQSTFNALVQNLLTNVGLPLARYSMLHDTSSILDTLKPTLTFQYEPVNSWAEVDAKTYITLDQLMTKEQGLARDNAADQAYYEAQAQQLMEYSLKNTVATKIFESSVVDYSDSNPITLSALLFNEWLRLSSQGIYTSYVSVVNPVTNETINLAAPDAFCFAMYCFAQTTGVTLENIPLFLASYVARNPLPPVSDLMSIVDPTLVSPSYAQMALSWMPPSPTTLISTDAFYAYVEEIYTASVYQRNLYSSVEHQVRRGMVWNLIDRIYCDAFCAVGVTGESYGTWLAGLNIHIDEWSEIDFESVYVDLVQAATGADLNVSNSLASVQAAMMGILQTLSSYSVQFITTINSSNVRLSDDGYVRVGDVDICAQMEIDIVDVNVDIQGVATSATQSQRFEMIDTDMINVEQSAVITHKIHLQNLVHVDPVELEYYYEVEPITVMVHPYPPLQPNAEGIVPVVGIDYFLALSLEQQQQFADVYNNPYSPIQEQVLSRVISTIYATGLVWNEPTIPIDQVVTINPTPGLVWNPHNLTTSLDTVVVQTGASGLVYTPNEVPLEYSILATTSPSLIYYPDVTPLQYSFAYRDASGLDFATEVPMYFSFKVNNAMGLRYQDSEDSSS
jgi:hypothetical protein